MPDPNLIFQVIVGTGMIAGMWRLTREVSSLAATMRFYVERTNDHEDRIRAGAKDHWKLSVRVNKLEDDHRAQ